METQMPRTSRLAAAAIALLICITATTAGAQSLGTFRWQLRPYCDVITVTVTQVGAIYRLEGTTDFCGAAQAGSVVGTAHPNPNGTIGIGLNVLTAPRGTAAPLSAEITLPSASGTWSDGGASGTFVLTPGVGTGGPPRPAPFGLTTLPSGAFGFNSAVGMALTSNGASSPTIPVEGAGTRMMWYAGKYAFRVGRVNDLRWNDAVVGLGSVAMGEDTSATGPYSFAVGRQSFASGRASAAFGENTLASGDTSTAVGSLTQASGISSLAGGSEALAQGDYSLAFGQFTTTVGRHSVALGRRAVAESSGSFVFGDGSSATNVRATLANQFVVRASNGVLFYSSAGATSGVALAGGSGAWQSLSDVRMKANFRDLDGEEVLEKLARMPIREWNYITQDEAIRHVGPTAQDFRAAFGLGEEETRINTVDADGIALRGVQALEARTRALQALVRDQADQLAELKAALERLLTETGSPGRPR